MVPLGTPGAQINDPSDDVPPVFSTNYFLKGDDGQFLNGKLDKMIWVLWAELRVNGDMERRLPGALNISIAFVEGEVLLMSLKDLAISTGSACTSASLEPSYVLRALGLSDELAHSSLRFSFGRFTTAEEVDAAAEQLRNAVEKLRESSPGWLAYQQDQG